LQGRIKGTLNTWKFKAIFRPCLCPHKQVLQKWN